MKFNNVRLIRSIFILLVLMFMLLVVWQYRAEVRYLLRSIWQGELLGTTKPGKTNHDARNVTLMRCHSDKLFGIDISHYQGDVLWDSIRTINDEFPIDYIFIRATMGEKEGDKHFKQNWEQAGNRSILRGAYHYYRPNENSIKQAQNFIDHVQLKSGDLPPVLDIEEHPKRQSMDSLRIGLKRWLDKVEQHYGVRPILYSGDRYYADFLEREFANYPLWIANYNHWVEAPKAHWDFWQFSERGTVNGIRGAVDLNLFQGTIEDLKRLCLSDD